MSSQMVTAFRWLAPNVATLAGRMSMPRTARNAPVCSNPAENAPVPQNKSANNSIRATVLYSDSFLFGGTAHIASSIITFTRSTADAHRTMQRFLS